MAMYRIYRKGNYIFIDSENTNIRAEGLCKDILVRVGTINSTSFHFTNINGFNNTSNGLDISNILKEDGNPYTLQEFKDFYTTETGSSINITQVNGTI